MPHEITLRRVFDAPRELIWREWTEPERLVFGEATVTLTDLGDGRTEMVFRTTLDAPDEVREQAQGGLESAFDRLAEELR